MSEGLAVFGVFLAVLIAYFLPWMVASYRKHYQEAAIFLTNLFFGWMLLGWIVALIWAFTDVKNKSGDGDSREGNQDDDLIECPMCAEKIKSKAKVCRFCGSKIDVGNPSQPA